MNELGQDQLPIPPHIELLRRMIPADETTRRTVYNLSNLMTKDELLGYEQGLLGAFAYLVEKDALGTLGPEDIADTRILFEWIAGIRPPFPPAEIKDRDILRKNAKKDTFQAQIEEMGNNKFTEGNRWKNRLLQCYRAHLQALMNFGILKFPNETLIHNGIQRTWTPSEQFARFEKGIRVRVIGKPIR